MRRGLGQAVWAAERRAGGDNQIFRVCRNAWHAATKQNTGIHRVVCVEMNKLQGKGPLCRIVKPSP